MALMRSLIITGCMALAVASPVGATPPEAEGEVRIGTFDSRALVHAYVNSELFRSTFAGVVKEYREARAKAEAQGDMETVRRLEAEMHARQDKLHAQGFSTAPVDDILASYPGSLEQIAREHGVSVIISKWDLAWQDKETPLVDLTYAMVQVYAPDERTLAWIKDMEDTEPVPIEELETGSDHTEPTEPGGAAMTGAGTDFTGRWKSQNSGTIRVLKQDGDSLSGSSSGRPGGEVIYDFERREDGSFEGVVRYDSACEYADTGTGETHTINCSFEDQMTLWLDTPDRIVGEGVHVFPLSADPADVRQYCQSRCTEGVEREVNFVWVRQE